MALPLGSIAPCLPIKAPTPPPSGGQSLHEIKHDGFRVIARGPKTLLFVLFSTLLILSGCTREEATASLRADLQADELEIIHARFPCRSPDMHFFGYRFRIRLKGEHADGYICWVV